MRISRHDLRRGYANSLVIDAGSHFTLRVCLQATIISVPKVNGKNFIYNYNK
jgi:hypothetical protein